jgi:hypothetical protein
MQMLKKWYLIKIYLDNKISRCVPYLS